MADMMYAGPAVGSGGGGDIATEDNANEFYGTAPYATPAGGVLGSAPNSGGLYNNNQNTPRPRYPGLYIGNLTWWTTDRDVIDAINSIGVTDVQEVKFFENRNNGQSKGFCVVTFNSDTSLPIVMEKLPTKELYGQNPLVQPYNRQSLNLFESQNKPRPQISNSNGPTSHGAGIMGINSITGVHAAAAAANAQVAATTAVANIPYAGVAQTGAPGTVGLGGYNPQAALGMNSLGGASGPRQPSYHSNMRMRMGGPRPMMRNTMPGSMNNGSMMPGHQMNRMRYMSQQNWNNNQSGYNSGATRVGPQMNMDISNRLGVMGGGGGTGGLSKQEDSGPDMLGSSSYYNSHHSSSQSDHYRSDIRDSRDHRDLRDEHDSRRLDDRASRLDDRSLRHDDRIRDERSSKQDDRSDRLRREDRSSRKIEDDRGSLRRSDDRRERDDRSSRRDEKSASSSRHHRERNHRSGERLRSRSRSKDRSREVKDRRDRDRDREREREKDRRGERY